MNLANLARQSHAMLLAWWSPCIIRPHCAADGEAGGGTEDVDFLKQFGLGEPCVICQDTS